jgi:hypothetical protein
MTNIVDDRLLDARDAAVAELKHLLGAINYSDMEPCEVVAFVMKSVPERRNGKRPASV